MKGLWESNINVWFPFMYSQKRNCAASLFPKQNYNVLSPDSYTHISVRDLYFSRFGLSILLQPNMWTNPGNIQIAHRHMNVEIGTEAAQFAEKEHINGIFVNWTAVLSYLGTHFAPGLWIHSYQASLSIQAFQNKVLSPVPIAPFLLIFWHGFRHNFFVYWGVPCTLFEKVVFFLF